MKIKKKIPLIDQHDKNYLYGKKFGGNYIPETLKKPIEDLFAEKMQIIIAITMRRKSQRRDLVQLILKIRN